MAAAGVPSQTPSVAEARIGAQPESAVETRHDVIDPDDGRVLVVVYGHLADTMAAIPALRSLRRAWPRAHIEALVLRSAAPVLAHCPYVDEVVEWTDFRHKGSRSSRVEKAATIAALAARLRPRRYRGVLVLHNSAPPMRLLSRLLGAPVRAGVTTGGDGYTHAAPAAVEVASSRDENRRVLAAVGVPDDGEPVELWTTTHAAEQATRLLADARRPIVGIHAGSDWSCQQWLPARFAAVARRLQLETGATIVLTGSRSEITLQEEIAGGLANAPILLAGRTGFDDFVEVIRRLDLLIAVNSAAAAIAGAVQTANLILLGPEDGRYTSTSSGGLRRVLQPGGSKAPGSWCELGRWGVLSGCESPMCRGVGGLDQLEADVVAAEALTMLRTHRGRSIAS